MGYYKKVEISGVNTAQLPVLSALQAKELFRRYHDGDESARELLIEGNLRLVLSVIKRFENRNEDMDDLFQVGVVGLLKAIENFNPDLDVMPSSYLCPMISGEVRRYLRDNNTIRVSRSLRDTAYRALQVRERLTAEKSKEPSVDEIAKEMGLPKESVVQALDAIQDPVSLFEPVYHDGICQIVDQTFLYRFSIHLCRSRIDRDLIEPHRRSCLRRVRRYPHCQSLRTTGKLHKQELICFHIYKWSNSLTDLLLPVVCTDRQLAFCKLMFIYCKEKSNLTGCLRRHVHLKYQLMSLCQFFCC